MVDSRKKDLTVAVVGRRLAEYMASGPFKSATFVLHPADPAPLGIQGLNNVPAAWFTEMEIPGYVITRVGRNGIRIE